MKGRMAKTIKEIADNCGVPEQTVRGWCRRNHVAKGSFALSERPKSSIWYLSYGKRFLNFERMDSVEISSSRVPKKWHNE